MKLIKHKFILTWTNETGVKRVVYASNIEAAKMYAEAITYDEGYDGDCIISNTKGVELMRTHNVRVTEKRWVLCSKN